MTGSRLMTVSDFDFELPPDLIAQTPLAERSASRMLVLPRAGGPPEHRLFSDIAAYLRPGDCLVVNDTRVIPARLLGRRDGSGGRVEAMLLEPAADGAWTALLRPGRRLKPGARVWIDGAPGVGFTVLGRSDEDTFILRFDADVMQVLQTAGQVPLPPYIERQPDPADRDRYQTVYARQPGAVAAPTAGLHFTDALLADLQARGIDLARVTLHVGLGTFQPVSVDRLEDHVMHAETYQLTAAAAATVNACRERGGRVVAVGTTSVRVLESCADTAGSVTPGEGRTRLFMHPPMRPACVDALLTNFHLPRSTLLMLVSTFASRERVLAAYRDAVAQRYRFFSYGDCMLLI